MYLFSVARRAALKMHLLVETARTLLKMFGQIRCELPIHPRTLLESSGQTVKKLWLQRAIETHVTASGNNIKLQLQIDSIIFFHDPSQHLWTILFSTVQPRCQVFIVVRIMNC